jgi:GxxExxY protein
MDFYQWRERRGEAADAEAEHMASLVLNAAFEVHTVLGAGHAEKVYEEALCHELELRCIPFQRQAPISILYKGRIVGEGWIDLLVGGKLVVEIKSVDRFADVHQSQFLSYLSATDLRLGLLINFNVAHLKQGIKRIVRDTQSPPS